MTHSAPLNRWLEHLESQGKSPHTLAAYHRAVTHFLRWSRQSYGDFDLAAIIPRDIEDWKAYQQTVENARPATINQRLAALSKFFQWCSDQGLSASNPTVAIRGLRTAPLRPKALSKTETRRLLRAVHKAGNARDIAMIELLLNCGLRVSELLALRVDDLTIGERSGHVVVRRGKGGTPRQVPLSSHARRALSTYLATVSKGNPEAPLWQGQRGVLKDRSSVSRLLKKYAFLAGIEPFSPHVLRHTFATRYLEANPDDLRGLAALLGHSSLNTVMIYTAPDLDNLAERMEKMR